MIPTGSSQDFPTTLRRKSSVLPNPSCKMTLQDPISYHFPLNLPFSNHPGLSPCDSSRHVGSHSDTFVPDISLVQNSLSLNSCMSEFSFHSDLASCHSPGETFSGFNLRESPSNLCHLTSFSSFFFLAHFCTLFF